MTRGASLCERRVKALPRLLHFVSALSVTHRSRRLLALMAVRIRPAIDHWPASTTTDSATDAPSALAQAVRWTTPVLLVRIFMKMTMMAVGAVGNRDLCGFPNAGGRVLRVHGRGGVHGPRVGDRRRLEDGDGGLSPPFRGRKNQAGSDPREGCDAGTPIAPQKRRSCPGRSRHHKRRNAVWLLLPGRLDPYSKGGALRHDGVSAAV